MKKYLTNDKVLATSLLAGGISFNQIINGYRNKTIFIYSPNESLQLALEQYLLGEFIITPQKFIEAQEIISKKVEELNSF